MLIVHKTRFGTAVTPGGEATARLMGAQGWVMDDLRRRFYGHSGTSIYTGSAIRRRRWNGTDGYRRDDGEPRSPAKWLYVRDVHRRADQGMIQTYIVFDGTLSSWWTKIVIGGLVLAFILLQKALLHLARRGNENAYGNARP